MYLLNEKQNYKAKGSSEHQIIETSIVIREKNIYHNNLVCKKNC
jgi:hypothetical protein